jgi:hypothetical protein
MTDRNNIPMQEAGMTEAEMDDAIIRLADYLMQSPEQDINTEAFCKACEALQLDAFMFGEPELERLQARLNQLVEEAKKAHNDWVDIDEVSLNRLAMYLVSYSNGDITTEVLYTACMACKMNPHDLTDEHMTSLQDKMNEFDVLVNGGSSQQQSNNDEVLDQVARHLVENTDGDITTDVLFSTCNMFGVDPLMLSEGEMASLQEKINAYAGIDTPLASKVIDDDAIEQLAKTILNGPVQQIDVEVLYNACRACNIDPYAMGDAEMLRLQVRLNALSGKA